MPIQARNALVADADKRVRRLCRIGLEREGYTVFEASNREELATLVADHKLDIVVADAILPGIGDPNEICHLQPTSGTQSASVIMLTELDDAIRVMGAVDGTVADYLAKPIRPKELTARLRAVTHRNAQAGELDRCHALLGEHTRFLTLLLDFSIVVAESEQLDRIVREAVEVTASLSYCRRVAILLPDSDRTTLTIAGAVGVDERTVTNLAVPIGEGVAGRVYASRSRLVVESAGAATPEDHVYDSHLYDVPPALAMAMQASEQTVGVLYLAERIGQEAFTGWELDYLNLLSNCAASAIQSILTRRSREEAREAITVALASLAEHRDSDTGQHLERMTGFCLSLVETLRTNSKYAKHIDSAFVENLRRAAPLHDVGKVAVPDHILLKPGKLTVEEVEIMRTHTEIGAKTIRAARDRAPESRFLAMAEEIAYGHHEWVDGSGYPRGLRGSEIPLPARIAALADVYDALTSRRVYKEAMSHAQARSIIVDLSGRQFDPVIVDAFVASEDKFQQLATELRDNTEEHATDRLGALSESHAPAVDPAHVTPLL